MDAATRNALFLAVPLMLFGLGSGVWQLWCLRHLSRRTLVPSDEHQFLRGRFRRRMLAGLVMTIVGGMIGYAFLSGLENRAVAIGQPRPGAADDDPAPVGEKVIPPEDRSFVKFWITYWLTIVVLVLALLAVAVYDAWASRRFWLKMYRELRDDHNVKLRRDLAVYKQQKEQSRGGNPGYGGRLGE